MDIELVKSKNDFLDVLRKLLFFQRWHPLGRKLAVLILAKVVILWVFFRIAPVQKQTITPALLEQKLIHHD